MGLDIYFVKVNRKAHQEAEVANAPIRKKIDELEQKMDTAEDQAVRQQLFNKQRDLYDQIVDVRKDVAYFRKVNFLIPFFGYEDNCTDLQLLKSSVEDLIEACDKVLADHDCASEILPTEDGFFFGRTEYDDYYFADVRNVRDEFKEILSTVDWENEELYMHCWW